MLQMAYLLGEPWAPAMRDVLATAERDESDTVDRTITEAIPTKIIQNFFIMFE